MRWKSVLEGRTARRLRKKVEMLFAHLKRILRFDRLRLRGPTGARDEFSKPTFACAAKSDAVGSEREIGKSAARWLTLPRASIPGPTLI